MLYDLSPEALFVVRIQLIFHMGAVLSITAICGNAKHNKNLEASIFNPK